MAMGVCGRSCSSSCGCLGWFLYPGKPAASVVEAGQPIKLKLDRQLRQKP